MSEKRITRWLSISTLYDQSRKTPLNLHEQSMLRIDECRLYKSRHEGVAEVPRYMDLVIQSYKKNSPVYQEQTNDDQS